MSKKIIIPFKQEMVDAILQGKKCCTSRTKKYGTIGDYFELKGNRYKLIMVSRLTLKDVAILYFEDEGFNTTEEFIELWSKIHPIKGYVPDALVYTHWFEREESSLKKQEC